MYERSLCLSGLLMLVACGEPLSSEASVDAGSDGSVIVVVDAALDASAQMDAGGTVIGSAGGLVTAIDDATLSVPPGALSSDASLTATVFSSQSATLPFANATIVSKLVRFAPSTLVFGTPATLTFTFDLAALPIGVTPMQLVIVRAPSSTNSYEILPTTAVGAQSVSAQTDRLGDFLVAFIPGTVPLCGIDSGATTWLRSTAEGTEVFVIGAPLEGTGARFGCFLRAFVAHDSTAHLDSGTVLLDGTNGSVRFGVAYDLVHEPMVNLLARQGAVRTERSPAVTSAISFSWDEDQLLLTYLGEARRLTSLADVLDALDLATADGAKDVLRMHLLAIRIARTRLLGYGSGAVSQYVSGSTFMGTLASHYTFAIQAVLKPYERAAYTGFSELTGMSLDGTQTSSVNTAGNGLLGGSLDFALHGRTRTVAGTVGYASVAMSYGLEAGGTYGLAIEGGTTYDVSYAIATDLDLRSVLPVSTP